MVMILFIVAPELLSFLCTDCSAIINIELIASGIERVYRWR